MTDAPAGPPAAQRPRLAFELKLLAVLFGLGSAVVGIESIAYAVLAARLRSEEDTASVLRLWRSISMGFGAASAAVSAGVALGLFLWLRARAGRADRAAVGGALGAFAASAALAAGALVVSRWTHSGGKTDPAAMRMLERLWLASFMAGAAGAGALLAALERRARKAGAPLPLALGPVMLLALLIECTIHLYFFLRSGGTADGLHWVATVCAVAVSGSLMLAASGAGGAAPGTTAPEEPPADRALRQRLLLATPVFALAVGLLPFADALRDYDLLDAAANIGFASHADAPLPMGVWLYPAAALLAGAAIDFAGRRSRNAVLGVFAVGAAAALGYAFLTAQETAERRSHAVDFWAACPPVLPPQDEMPNPSSTHHHAAPFDGPHLLNGDPCVLASEKRADHRRASPEGDVLDGLSLILERFPEDRARVIGGTAAVVGGLGIALGLLLAGRSRPAPAEKKAAPGGKKKERRPAAA